MKASVIIPTYNRPERLIELLGCLETQSFKDFETIVSIDGDPEETKYILADKEIKLDLKIHPTNSQLGRGQNRNHGVQYSSAEILIFFDDDMVIEHDLIHRHIEFHKTHSNSVLVGAILEHDQKNPTEAVIYKTHLSKKWMESKKSGPMDLEGLFITAANLSLPGDIFNNLNGFDKELQDCEDLDLGIRAIKMGIPVHFQPNIVAYHNDPISFGSLAKRQKEYGRSRMLVLKKNNIDPGPKPNLEGLRPVFRSQFWIWILDHFNVFYLLPKFLRYKFYDQIINAHFVT